MNNPLSESEPEQPPEQPSKQPRITYADKLTLTISLAILFHALIILGVTFTPEPIPKPTYDTLEVTLVYEQENEAVEDAQMLAQVSQKGGGEDIKQPAPTSTTAAPYQNPQPAPTPVAEPTPIPAPPVPVKPQLGKQATEKSNPTPPSISPGEDTDPPEETEAEEPKPEEIAAAESTPSKSVAETPAITESPKILTAPKNPEHKIAKQTTPKPSKEKTPEKTVSKKKPKEKQKPRVHTRPSAIDLMTNSRTISAISAAVKERERLIANRPKRKFISSATKEYIYAAYMETWTRKVEKIGNLNYPEEFRKGKTEGIVTLVVALNPDGKINHINIRRSSGKKILDNAAIRIVKLAAPYAPFTKSMLREVEILHITRSIRFRNNQIGR
ncbi:MAG: energy transducer TonB [Candidatus Eutrophobiaceae bacterium]